MATEYKCHLASQINGPIAMSWNKALFDHLAESEEWIAHRTNLSVSTATEEELNLIGKFLGIPRPYVEVEGVVTYASDEDYALFLLNITYLRRGQSLTALADMLYQFIPNGQFQIDIQSNGDLLLKVDKTYKEHFPYLLSALQKVYNTSPKVTIEPYDYHSYIQNGVLYTYYVEIDDPDYLFYYENNKGVISCLDTEKVRVDTTTHTIYLAIEGGTNAD